MFLDIWVDPKWNHKRSYKQEAGRDLTTGEKRGHEAESAVTLFEAGGRAHKPRSIGDLRKQKGEETRCPQSPRRNQLCPHLGSSPAKLILTSRAVRE